MSHSLFMKTFTAVLLAVAVLASSARPSAKEPPCEFDGIPRIVAVGDIHGAYGNLVAILRAAGITNEKDRWIGGKTHFVQTGDMLDRGADSRKVMDLFRRLEKDANAAGGRVHILLGNHESMRMRGSVDYTSAGEYAAFETPDSDEHRRTVAADQTPSVRMRILDAPLGMLEMMDAFSEHGTYGSWLRGLNTTVRINGVVFLHGGISPAVAGMSCMEINTVVRREHGVDLAKTSARPFSESLSRRDDGPLWYRELAKQPDSFLPEVEAILAKQHARAMVIGHTPRAQGNIGSRFGGRVYLIDTGMLTSYVRRGRASALEITNAGFTAIYTTERTPVLEVEPVILANDNPVTVPPTLASP